LSRNPFELRLKAAEQGGPDGARVIEGERMSGPESRPFYDSPWFKGVAALVALAALSVPLRGVVNDLFSSSLPRIETESSIAGAT
jgi:hypothetical protein